MNLGGTATYVSNLIRGETDSGNEVLLATGVVPRGESEDPVLQEIPFTRIENLSREISFARDFWARRNLVKLIEAYKPDLIHTHTFKAGFLVRSIRMEIPVVHTFHGHHLYDPEFGVMKRSILNFIERRLAPRSAALVTVGDKVGKELLDVGIGRSSDYESIPPGIGLIREVSRNEIREKFGLTRDEFTVVWLGRFTRVKRPDLVLEIATKLPEATFLMAGDGELLESIKSKAPANLRCLGIQNRDEMWGIADVALCTSDSEGMPLALIEAQMAGVPVVSTNVGSISEIVEDGVTGHLTVNSANELAEAINYLASDHFKREEMSRIARERAMRLFTVSAMVGAHLNLYDRVVTGTKR